MPRDDNLEEPMASHSGDRVPLCHNKREKPEDFEPSWKAEEPTDGKGTFMKNLITIAVVVVVGLVAFNYFQTGEFSILPASKSVEEQELNRLKGDFTRAAQEFRQAGRQAGLGGIDSTAQAESALKAVDGVERDLKLLKKRTTDPKVLSKIDDLLEEVREYKQSVR
jgi:hypothetical protein